MCDHAIGESLLNSIHSMKGEKNENYGAHVRSNGYSMFIAGPSALGRDEYDCEHRTSTGSLTIDSKAGCATAGRLETTPAISRRRGSAI